MPGRVETLLKRKSVAYTLAFFSLCFTAYCIHDFAHMARGVHARGLLHDMNGIMQQVNKMPPGVARGEEMARRLRALDTWLVPEEIKQALRDYTDALAGSIEAVKAGRDSKQFDTAMAQAKQRLADGFRKYQCL